MTAIYGRPNVTERERLWNDICQLARGVRDPWMLIGDFNAMLSSMDKRGGANFSYSQNKSFIDCCNTAGLTDTSFIGPRHTWYRGVISERIDRALTNDEWLLKFPFTRVHHLTRVYSDHRPILLRCDDIPRKRIDKPFRFLAPWLGHDEFQDYLCQAWSERESLPVQLFHLSTKLKKWNTDVFGNIFERKEALSNRLADLEKRIDASSSRSLIAEERAVRIQLEKTLWDEELVWIHKARLKGIMEGDRNTSFYHKAALRRRAFNKIQRLLSPEGIWVETDTELLKLAVNFFCNLYTAAAGEDGRTHKVEATISWKPANAPCFTLNTDGSVERANGDASAGGVLRNWQGRTVDAYTANLGKCSITRAELTGIIVGLERAWNAGIRELEIQTDSLAAVRLLTNDKATEHQHASLIAQYNRLLDRNWNISLKHIFREANHLADALAERGHVVALGIHTTSCSESN
ncbi:Putative ribonuclease H protein At1g65750, partial [Linum perenne]